MTTALHRRKPGLRPRLARVFAAIATSVALVIAPLVLVAPAHAADGDYIGETTETYDSAWPDHTLALMTVNSVYSDAIQAPFGYSFDGYGVESNIADVDPLPAGISAVIDSSDHSKLKFTGTPSTASAFDFTITLNGSDGMTATIRLHGMVATNKTTTTTALTAPSVAPYSSIPLSAAVSPASGPSGTVTFAIGGGTFTASLSGSTASTTAAVDASKAGSTLTTTATYSGDDDYATSSGTASTFIYGSGAVSGTVRVDGAAVNGAVVDLLDGTTEAVVDTKTVGADGKFTFARTVSTLADATAKYVLRATIPAGHGLAAGTELYYATTDTAASASTFAGAEKTGPAEWIGTDRDFYYYFAPTWADQTLATPRHNASYSDSVTASGSTTITYSVSAGSLPAGLSLNASTGLINGTPSAEVAYNFTVKAQNSYGSVTKTFSGTILPAGVPPTWTDKVLGDLQASAAFSDGVTASGDPTIVYTVSAGALPAGLALNAATGAVTGTPTSAGAYDFTLTATNDYGHVDQQFTGTIAAAPVIDLALDFKAGTSITDASSTISAGGLKVGSTYTLTMHSTPVILYTGTIGASGGFTWKVALPADTPAGAHTLILTGVAPDGSTMTAQAWFTLGANGKMLAISYSGPTELASTGASDPALPLGIALSLLLFGSLAVIVARRRRRA